MVRSVMDAGMGLVSCSINGDLARDAVLAYALDHEGKLPDAKSWQDDIKPYYERLYQKMMGDKDIKEMPEFLNFKIAAPGTVHRVRPRRREEERLCLQLDDLRQAHDRVC